MKKTGFWVIIIAAVFVLAAVGTLLVYRAQPDGATANIYSGGELVRSIDLSRVEESYSFVVTAEDGGENTVLVEPGRICISEADCPDKVCVHQGYIENGVVPIVCLPNQLVIRIEGTDDEFDGVAG
jgi:hypothetical protein